MKAVVIYVEGASDRDALEKLFEGLISQKLSQGASIKFRFPQGGKDQFVNDVPRKAANIICHAPDHEVVALPDLYPPNKGFPHRTCDDLRDGLAQRFEDRVREKKIPLDSRLESRFSVYCFKYDLEVLVLAAEERLRGYLGVSEFPVHWASPVEDQNHDDPPKKVVQRLFDACGRSYVETEDAPEILAGADYRDLKRRCPQCFAPFVDYLESR